VFDDCLLLAMSIPHCYLKVERGSYLVVTSEKLLPSIILDDVSFELYCVYHNFVKVDRPSQIGEIYYCEDLSLSSAEAVRWSGYNSTAVITMIAAKNPHYMKCWKGGFLDGERLFIVCGWDKKTLGVCTHIVSHRDYVLLYPANPTDYARFPYIKVKTTQEMSQQYRIFDEFIYNQIKFGG
jgi:hypothetical protein